MNPSQDLQQIQALLQANLLLESSVRTRILELNPVYQSQVIPILEALNAREHELLERVVSKNPDFFDQLEALAIEQNQEKFSLQKEKIADLLRSEAAEKADEMAELEDFLNESVN
jgi:hypothetical protein